MVSLAEFSRRQRSRMHDVPHRDRSCLRADRSAGCEGVSGANLHNTVIGAVGGIVAGGSAGSRLRLSLGPGHGLRLPRCFAATGGLRGRGRLRIVRCRAASPWVPVACCRLIVLSGGGFEVPA